MTGRSEKLIVPFQRDPIGKQRSKYSREATGCSWDAENPPEEGEVFYKQSFERDGVSKEPNQKSSIFFERI